MNNWHKLSNLNQDDLGHRIDKFAVRNGSALLLTDQGQLLAFGKNEDGLLGLGHKEPVHGKPQEVVALKNERIVDLTFGLFHVVALTSEGQVWKHWTFGDKVYIKSRINRKKLDHIYEGPHKITKVWPIDIVPFKLYELEKMDQDVGRINNIKMPESSDIKSPELQQLLEEFQDIFSEGKYDIGRILGAKCHIDLINQVPINLRPYKTSEPVNEIINTQIRELLDAGLIQKSISPYSCLIVMVNKKDEGKHARMCIDYRKLNSITIHENYPMPRMVDIEDRLLGAKYFTTLDIASGFHHVEVAQLDRKTTAFVTMNEQFEWIVMPFGLRNAPLIFQRIIYSILKQHNLCEFAHNYIDDIIQN